MQEFYIGWHQPNNGQSGCAKFERTIISVNRLLKRKSDFKINDWILDSGAFTRIAKGQGHLPVEEYARHIRRWKNCGKLVAAVSQDWMCDPFSIKATGLTVKEHQKRTVINYDTLLPLVEDVYIMPVLQGETVGDYLSHLSDYGSRLKQGAWVGIGSVCKKNSNPSSVESILIALKTARPDLRLHGFGIKKKSLKSPIIWDLLYSADSQSHGLSRGSGKQKYASSNDPSLALDYAKNIKQPQQFTIFSTLSSQPFS